MNQVGVVVNVSRYGGISVVVNQSCWEFTPLCLKVVSHSLTAIEMDTDKCNNN